MIDAAKELMGLVSHLPEYTLWILIGLLAYKVVIIGSVYGIIRLAINKFHDWATKPKTQEVQYSIAGKLIGGKDAVTRLNMILDSVRIRDTGDKSRYVSEYLHDSDLTWLETAIAEKAQRQREAKPK